MLIAFEGGEGAGKSSQIGRLATGLRRAGVSVVTTHEPGGTPFGRQIREMLLNSADPITPRSEALLFAADRADHVATVIRPALDRGAVVITDRYVDSSLAYQGAGRALSVPEIRQLSDWATGGLVADLTVVLDIAPEAGLARVRGRSAGRLDRLESEAQSFHRLVRDGFLGLAKAEPDRYLVLDAERTEAELAEAILRRVSGALPVALPKRGTA